MLYVSAVTTQTKPNAFKNLLDAAKGLTTKGVVAGFPRGYLNTPHYQNGSNAGPSIIDVAIWNNYGTNNIPRRDFMTPASKKWRKFFSESLDAVRRDMLDNKIDPDKFLKAMGQKGSDLISKEIIALDTPPNAKATIKAKGSSNPLVDTGDMARSTTWQIRKANER